MAATLQNGEAGDGDHDVAAAFPAPTDKFSDLNLVADALLRDLRPYRGAVPMRRVELQADLVTWAQRQWEEIARRAEDACWNTARRLKRVGVPLCLELGTSRGDFTSILFLRKPRRANGSSAISPNTASVNSNDPIAQLEAQTTSVMTIATAAPPTDSSAANDVRGTIGAPSSTRAWFEEQLTAAASEGREGSKKRLVAQERLSLYRLLTLMAAATGGRAEPAACCIVGDVLYLAVGSAVPKDTAAAAAPRADADIAPKLGDILDDVSYGTDAHLRDSASRLSTASACMTAADALDELFLPLTDRRLGDRDGEEEEGVLLTTAALHLAQRYDALRGLTAAAAVADEEDDATALQELDALSQVAARVRGLRRLRHAIGQVDDGPHRNGGGGHVRVPEDEAVLMQTVEAVAARLAASERDLLVRYQLFLERHATQARRVDDTWSRWTQPLDRIKRIDVVVLPTTVSAGPPAHTTQPQLNAEVQLYLYLRQMQRAAIEAPEFAPPQAEETRALYRAPTFEMASVIIATTRPTCAASTLFFHGGVAVPVVDDAGAHAAKMQAEHFSPRRKAQMLLDTSVPWMPPATVEPSATAVHTNDNHSSGGADASEGQQQHEGGFTMSAGDWQRVIHTLQRATSWTPR
jgi:hypothetical protein